MCSVVTVCCVLFFCFFFGCIVPPNTGSAFTLRWQKTLRGDYTGKVRCLLLSCFVLLCYFSLGGLVCCWLSLHTNTAPHPKFCSCLPSSSPQTTSWWKRSKKLFHGKGGICFLLIHCTRAAPVTTPNTLLRVHCDLGCLLVSACPISPLLISLTSPLFSSLVSQITFTAMLLGT